MSQRGIKNAFKTSKMEKFAKKVKGCCYPRKKLHLRCLTGFRIRLYFILHCKLNLISIFAFGKVSVKMFFFNKHD